MELNRDERVRRLTILSFAPQVAIVVAACIVRGGAQTLPVDLFAALAVLALASEWRCLQVGSMYVGISSPVWALAATIAGVVPAVCLILACAALDGFRRRLQWWVGVGNCLSSAMFAVGASVTFGLASDAGWAQTGTGGLPLWVFFASIAGAAANFAAMLPFALMRRWHLRDVLRESVLPAIPIEVSGAAIAAATAHAYYTLGIEAIGGFALFVAMLAWLLTNISRHETRREELATVEQRARERLAAGLHDDALQRLVLLRQDLIEGVDRGVLEGGINAIEDSLRQLLSKMGSFGTARPVGQQLEELAAIVGERSGLCIDVQVDPGVGARSDDGLVACARELLLNVEKHAQASRASLTVAEADDCVTVEVSDDGCGVQVDIADAINRGHVGLAIVSMRAAERGGHLAHHARAGGGLVARLELR